MCDRIFRTYPCDRSFCTKGGWRCSVLYPVFVCGILCAVPMFVQEQPRISEILARRGCRLPMRECSLAEVAYTLQVIAQKKQIRPWLLCFSAWNPYSLWLTGWVILGERLSGRELFGCALVICRGAPGTDPGKEAGLKRSSDRLTGI